VYYTRAEDLTGGVSLRWIVGETLFYFICNFMKIFLLNLLSITRSKVSLEDQHYYY